MNICSTVCYKTCIISFLRSCEIDLTLHRHIKQRISGQNVNFDKVVYVPRLRFCKCFHKILLARALILIFEPETMNLLENLNPTRSNYILEAQNPMKIEKVLSFEYFFSYVSRRLDTTAEIFCYPSTRSS